MTQTADQFVDSKALFNIIIAPTLKAVNTLAEHYGLTAVHHLDALEHSLRLPATGRERGDTINAGLLKLNHTVTIALIVDEAWIKALLSKNPVMAQSVWRSIQSKLLGHRTESQRNLLVVSTGSVVQSGVRDAIDKQQLMSFTSGQRVPTEWAAPRPETPKAAKPKPAVEQTVLGEYVEKVLKPRREAKGQLKNQLKREGNNVQAAPQKDAKRRLSVTPAQKLVGNIDLSQDLYLLCKGAYGDFGNDALLVKARHIVGLYYGVPDISKVALSTLDVALFETLIKCSSRGYWGGFTLLKDVVHAGAESPTRLLSILAGHIALIPAMDGQGKPVRQPQVNPKLLDYLKGVWQKAREVPAGEMA